MVYVIRREEGAEAAAACALFLGSNFFLIFFSVLFFLYIVSGRFYLFISFPAYFSIFFYNYVFLTLYSMFMSTCPSVRLLIIRRCSAAVGAVHNIL